MELFFLVALIAFAGSFVQSTTGFGYAVTCMALWPLLLPFKTAAVLELITALAMSLYIAARYWRYINWRTLVWPTLISTVTNWLGLMVQQGGSEGFLRRVLGVVLMALAVYFIFFSEKLKIRPTVRNGVIAGALSGLCGGMFSIGGPPIVTYYLSISEDKREYTATMQTYFVFTILILLAMHWANGNITGQVLQLSLAGYAGLAVGTGCGMALFRRLPLAAIKKLVYGFMLAMGLYILIAG